MSKAATIKVPELGVLRACLDLLEAERIWHRRWNCGAVKTGNRFFRFGQKGDADILAIIGIQAIHNDIFTNFPTIPVWLKEITRPIPLWIECKGSGGRPTQEQELFEREVLAGGHFYLLVRDVSTLQVWLKENKAEGGGAQ